MSGVANLCRCGFGGVCALGLGGCVGFLWCTCLGSWYLVLERCSVVCAFSGVSLCCCAGFRFVVRDLWFWVRWVLIGLAGCVFGGLLCLGFAVACTCWV